MLEETIERIAETILNLDEASLAGLWGAYKARMDRFEASRAWERAVIACFLINGVRVKNQLFNDQILKQQAAAKAPKAVKKPLATTRSKGRPHLRRIK